MTTANERGRPVVTMLRRPPVEFTFAALGPALTRVAVEHRGWETLADEQLSEDCALPGGYTSGAYSAGWQRILEVFEHTIA